MKTEGRGSYTDKEVPINGIDVSSVKWYDARDVALATTIFDSAQPTSQVTRFDRRSVRCVEVPYHQAVITYNKFMGGVDLPDGFMSYYRIYIVPVSYTHLDVYKRQLRILMAHKL